MRRKIRDVETTLPPGAGKPDISDDFGDVYGLLLAITGEGFSYGELEAYAKAIKKELSLIEGVARVDLWGVQDKVIYLDASQTQLSQLGFTAENFVSTLKTQNMVVDAGSVDLQTRRFRIAPSGEFSAPEDIGNLTVRPTLISTIQNPTPDRRQQSASELVRIRDIATVRTGYREPPGNLMRFNGHPALGIAITNVSGVNIVDMGGRVDGRLQDLIAELPVGIELHRVHWQSDVVAEAVNDFLISFLEAVGIVLVVLALFMGWRMGLVIGTALVATILGSFVLMAFFGIDLQRMSLGALVIALGMMVDNAIVVADGYAVRTQKGMAPKQAAIEAASQPAWPLLGATVVAVLAFYPIAGSSEAVGEYCRTLFSVVAISLLISWVISVTITPLQCIDMLPPPKDGAGQAEAFQSRFFQRYRHVLGMAIRYRFLTVGGLVLMLAASTVGFGQVKQLFFPDSSMPKFMIDVWTPEGTRIQDVATALKQSEQKLLADERVSGVASFMGGGPPRFYLPVDPEKPYASYAQLVVNVHDFRDVPKIIADHEPSMKHSIPQALVVLRPFGVGPSETWKFQIRISGPAVADPAVLRSLAKQVTDILDTEPLAAYSRTDWRQRVQKVVPVYSQERGRWASVSRQDLADATKRAFDGLQVGLYREQDDLIPIVLRHVEEERRNVGGLDVIQINPNLSTSSVPLSQVTTSIDTVWEDPLIWRRDRRRTITVQSNPVPDVTFPTMYAAVANKVNAIELPPGYTLEWGGELESTRDAQASLIPGVIPALAVMALIIVALFNAFRPPIVIALTIPFALIGIVVGLLVTNTPFGFMALLGAMSLAGMMIKNAIVLLDEINLNLSRGLERYDAVIEAGVSRLRPVALAAATTVLGVIPLLQDVFWIGMAVTIMAGLSFGTILTMIAVPVFYAILFRIETPKPAAPAAAPTEAPA